MSERAEYEFNQEENEVLARLAFTMKWTGVMVLIYTVLSAVHVIIVYAQVRLLFASLPFMFKFMVFSLAAQLVVSVGYFLVGIWTNRGGDAFRRVVDTKGNDLTHLMVALEQLRRVYSLIYWYLVVCLLLMALWMTFGLKVMQAFV